MNVEFEKALKYIDMESYEKAIECLNSAIFAEEDNDDLRKATEYRCVLGELYYQLGMEAQARDELTEVIQYCDDTKTLHKQRTIAKTYIDAMNGILPEQPQQRVERPKDMPLVPKPVQNKAFITQHMNRKHR